MESAIRNVIIQFEQEFMGRSPEDVRACIVRDLVVVCIKGVLTPAERQLATTADGIDMVKKLRQKLIAQGHDKLCEQVGEITGTRILAVFTDIDVQIGERVFVFAMDRGILPPCSLNDRPCKQRPAPVMLFPCPGVPLNSWLSTIPMPDCRKRSMPR